MQLLIHHRLIYGLLTDRTIKRRVWLDANGEVSRRGSSEERWRQRSKKNSNCQIVPGPRLQETSRGDVFTQSTVKCASTDDERDINYTRDFHVRPVAAFVTSKQTLSFVFKTFSHSWEDIFFVSSVNSLVVVGLWYTAASCHLHFLERKPSPLAVEERPIGKLVLLFSKLL